jgi:hypothetical protein
MYVYICISMQVYLTVLTILSIGFRYWRGYHIYIYGLYTIIKGYEEIYLDIYDIDVENPWFQKMIYT